MIFHYERKPGRSIRTNVTTSDREKRVKAVNELIVTIASFDRKFLSNHSDGHQKGVPFVPATFELRKEQLWYLDAYKGTPIYLHNRPVRHRRFTDGGTLWNLVMEFRDYIMYGTKREHSTIYLAARDEYWGYKKESAELIIKKAKEVGFL